MKRLTAALTAALIALTVTLPVYAVPDEDEDTASQTETSAALQDENETEETSADQTESAEDQPEETDAETPSEENTNSDNTEETTDAASEESSAVSEMEGAGESSAASDPDTIEYQNFHIINTDMNIDIPKDMYILTPEIEEGNPALEACGLTKAEMEQSFLASGTYIKAYSKDFSYDITVSFTENERTKAIGNLTRLADAEVENLIKELIQTEYVTGCSRANFNGTLFLMLEMEYASENIKTYAVQEYSVVDNTSITITLQSHNKEVSQPLRQLFNNVMKSTTFHGVKTEQTVADPGSTTVGELDTRYFCLMIAAIVAVAALAAIIIVAIRRHQTVLDEMENGTLPEKKSKDESSTQKSKKKESTFGDDSLFRPSDEEVLFRNERLEMEKKKKEATRTIPRLDATTELEIPKNPYTPVGKAEAVAQPAMSVTSEFTKMAVGNTEEVRNDNSPAEPESENPDHVVFAESAAKTHTEIEQIGEEVLIRQEQRKAEAAAAAAKAAELARAQQEKAAEETEPSAYERHFGKMREPEQTAGTTEVLVPVDEDEKRMSKYERHFGTPVPAVTDEQSMDPITAVDVLYRGEKPEDKTEEIPTENAPAAQESHKDEEITLIEIQEETKDEPVPAETESSALSEQEDRLSQDYGTEIYRAPEKPTIESDTKITEPDTEIKKTRSDQIELAIAKDADGKIIIDAVSGSGGEPVRVAVTERKLHTEKTTPQPEKINPAASDEPETVTTPSPDENSDATIEITADSASDAAVSEEITEDIPADHEQPAPETASPEEPSETAASSDENANTEAAAASETETDATAGNDTVKTTDKEEASDQEIPSKENSEHEEPTMENQSNETPIVTEESPKEPESSFARDCGIIFETAQPSEEPLELKSDRFTTIPKLESVNAEEYNKKLEELRKTPEPKPEPEPEPEPLPQPEESPVFYNGEADGTLDPFAPGSGELPPEDKKPQGESFGAKLKRSLSKLFSSAEEEDE